MVCEREQYDRYGDASEFIEVIKKDIEKCRSNMYEQFDDADSLRALANTASRLDSALGDTAEDRFGENIPASLAMQLQASQIGTKMIQLWAAEKALELEKQTKGE